MIDLQETSPAAGLLPITVGTVALREIVPARVVSVLPYASATPQALKKTLGMPFPAPGGTQQRDGLRAVWIGQNEALLIGERTPDDLAYHAALVDQTDMWCFVELTGAQVEDVLARLVPIDLRQAVFATGTTARTLLGHLTASVTRTGDSTFEVAVFRSMAGTLIHDLQAALEAVAARG